jgi:hypothetical protein
MEASLIKVVCVSEGDPLEFEVRVRDEKGESSYVVTMAQRAFAQLAPGYTAEHCIEAAFRFLLDRESKESILKRFDVAVIPRYFPEFEQELPRYLTQS